MAISASGVWEVQTGGSDTNGGGYVTGSTGTDYSLVAGKRTAGDVTNISVTNGVTAGTTTITSATANFSSALIGNIIYVAGGTGSVAAGWYQVITVPLATSITVDRSTGLTAGTGVTINIGGALLSPSIAAANATTAGQTVFVLNGTYTISSNTTNAAGGAIAMGSVTNAMIGYSSSRTWGNTGTAPLLQTSGSTISQLQTSGTFENITFDGAAQTASRLISAGSPILINCTVTNFNTVNAATSGELIACRITANSVTIGASLNMYCEADSNTATPLQGISIRCLSYSNTGATTDGFTVGASGVAIECHAISNGRSGFRASSGTSFIANCHAQSNGVSSGTGYGYQGAGNGQLKAINCTGVSNQTGLVDTSVTVFQSNVSSVSGDVYVSVAGNNYALNNTASAGAALRAAGRMMAVQTYPRGLTTSTFDIGGVQHADPAVVVTVAANPLGGFVS